MKERRIVRDDGILPWSSNVQRGQSIIFEDIVRETDDTSSRGNPHVCPMDWISLSKNRKALLFCSLKTCSLDSHKPFHFQFGKVQNIMTMSDCTGYNYTTTYICLAAPYTMRIDIFAYYSEQLDTCCQLANIQASITKVTFLLLIITSNIRV